jgi:hypothetical protein
MLLSNLRKRTTTFAFSVFSYSLAASSNELVLSSGNEEMCSEFVSAINHYNPKVKEHLPDGVEYAEQLRDVEIVKLTQEVYGLVYSIDLDNNQIKDSVIQGYNTSSYMLANPLYVLFDTNGGISDFSAYSLNEFDNYPCKLDKNVEHQERCPPETQDYDFSRIKVSIDSDEIVFKTRYTSAELYRLGSKNYIFFAQSFPPRSGAVVELMSEDKIKTHCIFHREAESED